MTNVFARELGSVVHMLISFSHIFDSQVTPEMTASTSFGEVDSFLCELL